MVLRNCYPPDIRVSNEAQSLSRAGYKVTIICYRKPGEKRTEKIDDVIVKRIASPFIKKVNYFLVHLIHIDVSFFLALRQEVKNNFQAVHVHDLPLLNTVLLSRFNKKVKLIADLHENYPAAIESWYQPNSFIHRLLRPIIFNKDVWTEREKQV